MGEKVRKTVSIDRELEAELDEWSNNHSAIVNELLNEYFKNAGDGPIGLEVKLRDVESRIDETLNERDRANRRLERLRNRKDRLEKEISRRQEKRKERLRRAENYVAGRSPDNPAVQNWAEKLGMPPAELVDRVEQLNGSEA